jgi:hypothetical protein
MIANQGEMTVAVHATATGGIAARILSETTAVTMRKPVCEALDRPSR